jgi:hypothetical protein
VTGLFERWRERRKVYREADRTCRTDHCTGDAGVDDIMCPEHRSPRLPAAPQPRSGWWWLNRRRTYRTDDEQGQP